MSDSYEVKAAVLGKKRIRHWYLQPAIFDEKGKLLTGGDVPAVIAMLEGPADALGINQVVWDRNRCLILEDILKIRIGSDHRKTECRTSEAA